MEVKYTQIDAKSQEAYDNWIEYRRRCALLKKDELSAEAISKIGFKTTENVEFYTFPPEEIPLLEGIKANYPNAFQCYTD